MMWLADTSATRYAGGAHSYSLNAGTTWTTNATYDHVFRIYDSATLDRAAHEVACLAGPDGGQGQRAATRRRPSATS